MPSRSSNGPVRMSSCPHGARRRAAAGVVQSGSEQCQQHHRLSLGTAATRGLGHSKQNTVHNVSLFILVCLSLAVYAGYQCFISMPRYAYFDVFMLYKPAVAVVVLPMLWFFHAVCGGGSGGPTNVVAVPCNAAARSGGNSITTVRLTQQQYILRGFILMCIILTAGYQCYNSLHRYAYSDVIKMYTPAVRVIPLSGAFTVCTVMAAPSGHHVPRPSYSVHGTNENKLQNNVIKTSLKLLPTFFSLLCVCAIIKIALSISAATQSVHTSIRGGLAFYDTHISLLPPRTPHPLPGDARLQSYCNQPQQHALPAPHSSHHQHHSKYSYIFKYILLLVFTIWLNMLKTTLHLWTPEFRQQIQPPSNDIFHGRKASHLVPEFLFKYIIPFIVTTLLIAATGYVIYVLRSHFSTMFWRKLQAGDTALFNGRIIPQLLPEKLLTYLITYIVAMWHAPFIYFQNMCQGANYYFYLLKWCCSSLHRNFNYVLSK